MNEYKKKYFVKKKKKTRKGATGKHLTKPLKLSPELAEIVGSKDGEKLSRPEVVKRLWAYIKEHNLQDPDQKQFFTPDVTMAPIFGKERIRMFGMIKYCKGHLKDE